MTIRKRVLVSGHVQGVFFRATCHREAVSAGVSGSVRNLDDGRVEACFEGSADAVERLVAWCHEGPPHARVIGVEVLDEPPTGQLGFD